MTLSTAHLKVIDRIMNELSEGRSAVPAPEWEEFAGDMRDHVDSVRALVVANPGMGYVGIAKEFEWHLRAKLSAAHLRVVRCIVDSIAQGRAVPGPKRAREDFAECAVDVRDHAATIEEIMMQDPSMDYQGVARRLEEELQVELSGAEKQAIRGVMARISIRRVADDQHPARRDFPDFDGNLREHVEIIQELMTLRPTAGREVIAHELERRLERVLTDRHVKTLGRIMIQISSLSYEFLVEQAAVVQRLVQGHAEPAARRKAVQEYFERGVSLAVLARWMAEHFAPEAGGCPVRRVWKDGGLVARKCCFPIS